MKNFLDNLTKVIAYDVDGVAHVLYDGTAATANPMPELETGMFIKLECNQAIEIGFIYDKYIIWKDGGWDNVCDIHEDDQHNNEDFAYLTIYEIKTPYYFPKKDKSEDEHRKIVWEGEVYYG